MAVPKEAGDTDGRFDWNGNGRRKRQEDRKTGTTKKKVVGLLFIYYNQYN